MVEQKKTGKQKNRETILLIAVAVVGLAGLVVLQLANNKGSGDDPKSVL